MKVITILIMLVFWANVSFSQSNNDQRLTELSAEIDSAVEQGNYKEAANLKKERQIREDLKKALAAEDYDKASVLKKELNKLQLQESDKGETKQLENQLEKALADENYEEAAKIKAKIKEIESGGASKETSVAAEETASPPRKKTKSKVSNFSRYTAKAGLSVPILEDQEFGDFLGTGFMVGLQTNFASKVEGLSFYGGLNFSFNPLDKGLRDEIEQDYIDAEADDFIQDYVVRFERYINITLNGGVSYEFVDDLYGRAGFGLNFLKVTRSYTDVQTDVEVITDEIRYDLATSLAFVLAAGYNVSDELGVEIQFNALGSPDISGEFMYRDSQESFTETFTESNLDPFYFLNLGVTYSF